MILSQKNSVIQEKTEVFNIIVMRINEMNSTLYHLFIQDKLKLSANITDYQIINLPLIF